jgi:hypothetical protein
MTPPKKPPRRVWIVKCTITGRLWASAMPGAPDVCISASDVVAGPYVLAPKRRAKKRKGA